ncbi:MAG: T9SS type A sorting domain-containing protein [Ignavibacteriae bacterium]|nr:T9SS C-terminal target domain-containing protein [Ignavibacteriota bacterium]NOH00166.1 T9SS type A sorting domain-containing protein [Ignavibacteriota bacterium]
MKIIQVVLCIFTLSINLIGQTIYNVEPGSKDNQIILSLISDKSENTQKLSQASIYALTNSKYISLSSTEIRVALTGEEQAAVFTFDAARDAEINLQEKISLLIKDNLDNTFTKDIFIKYTGPTVFKLEQNYPNPFNPSTKIQYQLSKQSEVKLFVYDLLGRRVQNIVNEIQEAGYYEIDFNASNLSSGVYFYTIEAIGVDGTNFVSSKKMMLMK